MDVPVTRKVWVEIEYKSFVTDAEWSLFLRNLDMEIEQLGCDTAAILEPPFDYYELRKKITEERPKPPPTKKELDRVVEETKGWLTEP